MAATEEGSKRSLITDLLIDEVLPAANCGLTVLWRFGLIHFGTKEYLLLTILSLEDEAKYGKYGKQQQRPFGEVN